MTGNIRLAVELPPALYARLRKAARETFETPDSMIPLLLEQAIPERARERDGGKPPARKLRRPLKPHTKRARMLTWIMGTPGARVPDVMAAFGLSRPAVFATLVTLNREHGVGYRFDGATERITIRMPRNGGPIGTV